MQTAEDHLDVIDSATTTPTDTTTASITTSQPFPTSTDVPQPDVSVPPPTANKNHLPANLHLYSSSRSNPYSPNVSTPSSIFLQTSNLTHLERTIKYKQRSE